MSSKQPLSLPRDLTEGALLVTVTGREELCIENHRGILEYTDTRLVIQGKSCRLEVLGCPLVIHCYSNEELRLLGKIEQINYLP